MMKKSRHFPLILIVLIFTLLSGCRSLTTLYFHPSTQYFNDPKDYGISYEAVTLETPDGVQLENWLFHAEGELKGRIVFFHGNAENISTHFGSVHWLPKAGYEVFLVDYRGFGKSSGVPVLPDVLSDMQVSYEWMQRRASVDNKPIYVLGQSIGAALSVMAIANMESQPDCVVLDAGFGSFQDMARISFQRSWLFWLFAYPASWLLPSDLEPEDYADKLKMPVLQFHSPNDQVIPYDQGVALSRHFEQLSWVDSSGLHIATFNLQKYRNVLLDFYQTCNSQ
ncbi:alpha/beta hydrolase [Litoribrevibacter euphylliae]|uniref:Alpha/beta hydrolase n=1 Tax=Litoribrevibacter euphylliae TaxID=1834034 RepID=A0ABV7H881_9GAMM